jgi:hypothetical protein
MKRDHKEEYLNGGMNPKLQIDGFIDLLDLALPQFAYFL